MKTRLLDVVAALLMLAAFAAAFNGMDAAQTLSDKAIAGFLALPLAGLSILTMIITHEQENQ